MCTIITVSNEFFKANRAELLVQIEIDAITNADGWTLFLLGGTDDLILRSKSLAIILATLEAESDWSRMFLHARFATGSSAEITDTHGWQTRDGWLVMHNGWLTCARSRTFPVDSQLIVQTLETTGPEVTIDWLHAHVAAANVFLVHPGNMQFYVSRSRTGTLFTDALGNFSTHPIKGSALNKPVKDGWAGDFELEPSEERLAGDVGESWADDPSAAYEGYRNDWSRVTRPDPMPSEKLGLDEFYDWVWDHGYHNTGIPESALAKMTKVQAAWLRDIIRIEKGVA